MMRNKNGKGHKWSIYWSISVFKMNKKAKQQITTSKEKKR